MGVARTECALRGCDRQTPMYSLHQCIRRLAVTRRHHEPPDFRASALTKLMKAPLSGEGRLLVLTTLSPSEEHVDAALGALQLTATATKLPQIGGRVHRSVHPPQRERQEHLEANMATVARCARAAVTGHPEGSRPLTPRHTLCSTHEGHASTRNGFNTSMDEAFDILVTENPGEYNRPGIC